MKRSYTGFVKVLSALLLLQGNPAASAEIMIPEIPPDLITDLPPDVRDEIDVGDFVAGNVITDADTVQTQVQPVVSAVRERLRNVFRVFARPARGGGAAAEDDFPQSVWVSYNKTDFENTFSRTRFEGTSDLTMLGYDVGFAEDHVLGFALGNEKTEIDTFFNGGGVETEGVTAMLYYGWLFADNWSLDAGFGRTELDTEQFRVLPEFLSGTTVTSETSAERSFSALNLNGFWTLGDFSLGARLGYLSTKNERDGYTESDGTVLEREVLEFKQTHIGADIAYGIRSQPYLGVTLMKDSSSDRLVFPSGEQPSNDEDSLQLAAGWRYYGENTSVTLEWNRREGKDQYLEDALWFTLRYTSE
jgi:hypothetical protein